MRSTLLAILIAFSLFAADPALAASNNRGFVEEIPRNFMTGASFYFETVGEWISALLARLGLPNGSQSQQVTVLAVYSACQPGDRCASDATCTDICPTGAVCETSHRCLPPIAPSGRCVIAADCREVCGNLTPPPIGPAAFLASCVEGACRCAPVVTLPDAVRAACPSGISDVLACPTGTHQACTFRACASGECPARATCLTDPAYGGSCFGDEECTSVTCAEGATPFCDADQRCKCRKSETLTIVCAQDADCGAAVCAAGEISSCHAGSCACARAGVTSVCTTASDCSSDCPQGYSPACEQNACVCQKTTANVPVACRAVAECGAVSCPTGYDKACIESKCACTRTFQPQ